MLKKRLIVSLLWSKGVLVQSINFKHTNVVGSVYTAIEFFNTWEADEIVLINVGREDGDYDKFLEVVKKLSQQCFLPLSVGGWIHSKDRAINTIQNGADKLVINTQAFLEPEFIESLSNELGSQCVVVSIDAKRNSAGLAEVFIDRGRQATETSVKDYCIKAEQLGAGEIYITSIDHDGSKKGYDIPLVREVSSTVSIPVIAFGGVGKWDHMVEGIIKGGADAVAAGNIFHFFEQSTRAAKYHLANSNVDVRSSLLHT